MLGLGATPGCLRRELGYDQQRIMAEDGPAINATIHVVPFVDQRRENQDPTLFGDDEKLESNGNVTCINAEKNYLEPVPEALAAIITEHVQRRGLFHPKGDQSPKYFLRGTLVALYGAHKRLDNVKGVARKAALAGGGPLVLATSVATAAAVAPDSPTHIEIVFTELRLRNANDGTERAMPNVEIIVNANLQETGTCERIYDHVDQYLKQAVEKLASQIEETVRNWPPSATPDQTSPTL